MRVGVLGVMALALDAPPADICGGDHDAWRTRGSTVDEPQPRNIIGGGQGVHNARTRLTIAHVKDVAFFYYELPFARSEVRFGDCRLLCVGWWHGGAWSQVWTGRMVYVSRPV